MKVNIGPYNGVGDRDPVEVSVKSYDVHSADHTLALVIYPVLIKFKEVKESYPTDIESKLREFLGGYEFPEGLDDDEVLWDWVLDEIIWAFSNIKDEVTWLLRSKEQERLDNGLLMFGIFYKSLWS